jgi:nondiscriminating glutamyl-tRNA synthetase
MSLNANKPVRVRFAPSPTGYLHVGGARTALYNLLYAHRNGGKFILRIEDTDAERSTEDSLKIIVNDLRWLGLNWDEGPDHQTLKDVGNYGPYYQSHRQDIYAKYAQQLLSSGKAYYCFLTDEEIEKQREIAIKLNKPQQVDSPYQDWTLEQAQAHKEKTNAKAVVRFKTKNLKKDYIFTDLVRGEVKFPSDMVGDFVLLRSDGMPVYNFCCVIDDALMEISHVLRAEEHLPNTLRQLMIYEALGLTLPQFGHLSLVLNDERQKLSKRHGSVAVSDFREAGYLPEAILNFVAMLGWSSPDGREVLSLNDMKAAFSLDRLHSAGAVFDRVKLKWINSQHLRQMDETQLWKWVEPFLKAESFELPTDGSWQVNSLKVFKTKMETLKDAVELYRPISDRHFAILDEANEALAWPTSKMVIAAWLNGLKEFAGDFLSEEQFLELQNQIQNSTTVKGKNLFMPIRVAVIGKPHGAELKILIPLMKKDSLIKRAEEVLKRLG